MIYDEGALDFEPDALERIAFTARVCIAVHRALSGRQHNPCCAFYCLDGPNGWAEPLSVCACRYPVWEVRRT